MQHLALYIAFVAIWVLAFVWHFRENTALKRNPSSAPFRVLLVGRSVQCLLLLAVCFVLMGIVLVKSAPRPAPPLPAIAAPIPHPVQQPVAQPPATPQSAPVTLIPPAPTPVAASEATLDAIKERYEGTLINYFFLRQCGKAGDVEYTLVTNALQAELARNLAPAGTLNNILLAAQGSYNEIYSRLPCDHKDAAAQEAQFRQYLDQLRSRQ